MADLDDDDDVSCNLELQADVNLNDDDEFNIAAYDANRNKKRSMRRSFGSSQNSESKASVSSEAKESRKAATKEKGKSKEKAKSKSKAASKDKSKKPPVKKSRLSEEQQSVHDPATVVPTSTAPETEKEKSDPQPQPQKRPKNLKNDYKIWLQIVNDNKLSRHNPFQLKLIDYMTEMCTNTDNRNNFQFAATSVDAGARIYAKKVDTAHEDAFRVLKEVNSKKFRKESKKPDSQAVDSDGEPIEGGGGADGQGTQIDPETGLLITSPKKKKKKPRKKSNFIMTAEKEDNMVSKTKSSIINPNLRYQYILNSMNSTSIGNLRVAGQLGYVFFFTVTL